MYFLPGADLSLDVRSFSDGNVEIDPYLLNSGLENGQFDNIHCAQVGLVLFFMRNYRFGQILRD